MCWVRLALSFIVMMCLIVGCERREVTSATTAPATAPGDADATLASQQAATPRVAHMLIDQRRVEFPPAKLALRARGGQVLALLYSDDPPDAIDDNYAGNSFYLEMILDIPQTAQLADARWTYKAPSSERADTVSGIFLAGRKKHLQPEDVVVEFDGAASPVRVSLRGRFLQFESSQDPTVPGSIVPVGAEMDAELFVKPSAR